MHTIDELWDLTRQTLGLWARHLPRVGTYYLLGWAVYTLGVHASVQLGAEHKVWATLVFVLGIIAQVMSMVMMIHALEPTLRTPALIAQRGTPRESVPLPPTVFERENTSHIMLQTIGPFLGVLAVWGVFDGWIKDLFTLNAVVRMGAREDWSVSFRDAGTLYLTFAICALVLRIALGRLARRWPKPWLVMPLIFTEGLWEFATFFVFLGWAGEFTTWLTRRVIWNDLLDLWQGFVDALPDWHLPFGWVLPDVVKEIAAWVVSTFVPLAWSHVLLPLMWLALTATVFGWREFSVRAALGRTRAARAAEKLATTAQRDTVVGSAERAFGTVARVLTVDLQDKWVPIAQSIRLIARSGPRFIAAYLIVATVVDAASGWFNVGLTLLLGPTEPWNQLLMFPLISLVTGFLTTTISMCLYVAAYDHALADVAGLSLDRDADTGRVVSTRVSPHHLPPVAPAFPAPLHEPVVPPWAAPTEPPTYPTLT